MNKKKVVLAGAGTMGASLAQVYALGGWETYLYNRSQKGLDRAKELIKINESVLVRENIISPEISERIISEIVLTTENTCFADADLVVESIVEDLDAKRAFWAEKSGIVRRDAILATNTSGLHITDIAEAVINPSRFVGQHSAEITRRKQEYTPKMLRPVTGYLKRYRALVSSANCGAFLDDSAL